MKSQTIIGIIFMIVGFLLSLTIVGALWGIPLMVIGFFLILLRNEEDKIEQIRTKKTGGKK